MYMQMNDAITLNEIFMWLQQIELLGVANRQVPAHSRTFPITHYYAIFNVLLVINCFN